MSMNATQEAAFIGANAGNTSFTPEALSFLIIGLIAAVVILWFVWVCMNAYKAWGGKKLQGQRALYSVFRALFIMITTFVIIGI